VSPPGWGQTKRERHLCDTESEYESIPVWNNRPPASATSIDMRLSAGLPIAKSTITRHESTGTGAKITTVTYGTPIWERFVRYILSNVPEDMDLGGEIHLRATALLGTVHTIVARRAWIGAGPSNTAGHLDIFTGSRTNFPARCTIAIAIYASGRHLDEASCKNQAEGYREYFHRQGTVTRDRQEEALVNESVSNVFDR